MIFLLLAVDKAASKQATQELQQHTRAVAEITKEKSMELLSKELMETKELSVAAYHEDKDSGHMTKGLVYWNRETKDCVILLDKPYDYRLHFKKGNGDTVVAHLIKEKPNADRIKPQPLKHPLTMILQDTIDLAKLPYSWSKSGKKIKVIFKDPKNNAQKLIMVFDVVNANKIKMLHWIVEMPISKRDRNSGFRYNSLQHLYIDFTTPKNLSDGQKSKIRNHEAIFDAQEFLG